MADKTNKHDYTSIPTESLSRMMIREWKTHIGKGHGNKRGNNIILKAREQMDGQ